MSLADLFPDRATQDAFFAELLELVGRYPSIGGRMAATFAADPHAPWAQPREGFHDQFDPAAPMMVENIMVLIGHRNIDGFEDLSVVRNRTSSHYADIGMLTAALAILS